MNRSSPHADEAHPGEAHPDVARPERHHPETPRPRVSGAEARPVADTEPPATDARDKANSHITERIVALTIVQAVTRTERLFAVIRGSFCLAIATLFVVSPEADEPRFAVRAALELGPSVSGILASVLLYRWLAHRPATQQLRIFSVALDATLCMIALSGRSLAPNSGYLGLAGEINPAVVPLLITSSVLRVSRKAVTTSATICVSGLVALLYVESLQGLHHDPAKVALLALYVATAIGLSYFTTARAREIFARVGQAVVQAEGARMGLLTLLQDHHDLRSFLGSLQLRADLLGEALETSTSGQNEAARLQMGLQQSLEDLSAVTERTRDRALGALSDLGNPRSASVGEAIVAAARALPMDIGLQVAPHFTTNDTHVLFGGGTDGLGRLLAHLFVNAAEGDGKSRASRVTVTLKKSSPAMVDLILQDNGPGFSAEILEAAGRSHGTSTKPGSAGIGLWLGRSTVLAAGGELSFSNTDQGARIVISLPLAVHLRASRAP